MTCYPKDLRERAIEYLLDGHTPIETSKVFNLGKTAVPAAAYGGVKRREPSVAKDSSRCGAAVILLPDRRGSRGLGCRCFRSRPQRVLRRVRE